MPDAPHSHIQTRFISTVRRVDTKLSIQGGGPLDQDLNISLVNDQDPEGFQYYGTDIFGTRGWYGAFIASGPQHTAGLVPDPGPIAGTTRYLCEDGLWKVVISGGGGGSGTSMSNPVAQTGHGFAVGDVVRHTGSAYARAKADTSSNAEVVGLVTTVTDADNFTITTGGLVSGLSGLTAGSVYFLSTATAGLLTTTAPSVDGQISKPLLIASSTTGGYWFNWRGWTVGSPVGGGGGGGGGSVAWTDITGKPSTFPPTVPIAWTDLSGKPSTFPPTVPIAWTDISGKPSTFPPTLPIAQSGITNLVTDLAGKEPSLPAGGTTSNFLRGDKTWATVSGAVTSVFTRTGAVVAASGDYAAFYSPVLHTHDFPSLTSIPTTVSGYGITDVYTKTQSDANYALSSHTHTFASLTSKPTTISGYGITDAFTQTTADTLYATASHTHTFASLTSKPTTISGYGITDAFTQTTADTLYATTSHTHTFASLTSKPTTVSGYGITDVYTKSAADAAFEPVLGLPAADNYILVSTSLGVRSWVAPTGGGNVSNSGTPTSGQYGRWVTATTIAGVSIATMESDLGITNITNDAQIKASDFPSTSVDSEISLFSGTTGKAQKRATGTGLVTATAGVYGTVTANSSAVGLGSVTNDAQIKASDFPSTSVDGEISLFSGTTGKAQKRATGSGAVLATSGVYGTLAAGTVGNQMVSDGTTWVSVATVPQNTQNVGYGLVASDAGKHIFHDTGTSHTYTIPANSAVAFPIGTAITFVNNTGAGTLNIAITTDTLRRGDGTAGTGTRSLSADSVATILKTKATEWMISGKFT